MITGNIMIFFQRNYVSFLLFPGTWIMDHSIDVFSAYHVLGSVLNT